VDYKKYYERKSKQQISYRTWERLLALMKKFDLSLNKTNLDIITDIKTEAKRNKIPCEIALKNYLLFFDDLSHYPGSYILLKLDEILKGSQPHRTTIKRWLGDGFTEAKIYTALQTSNILLQAYLYKLRNQNATNQSSNRSSPLSVKKA
jgi:hypothetical protein